MKPIIEVENLHKTYQLGETTIHALRGASLKIFPKDFAAIVGSSGSGKSTLLNMIGTIDDAQSGTIRIEDVDFIKLNDHEKSRLRNRKIGFVFQTFNLIPVLNVEENIALPLSLINDLDDKTKKERVKQALIDVDLEKFHKHMPEKLSGGQRQRVAIARALVTNPAIILADEPTANLDSQTTHKIIDLMLDLNEKRGVTFLFSTHDEKLIGRVKKIFRITDGMIQETH